MGRKRLVDTQAKTIVNLMDENDELRDRIGRLESELREAKENVRILMLGMARAIKTLASAIEDDV